MAITLTGEGLRTCKVYQNDLGPSGADLDSNLEPMATMQPTTDTTSTKRMDQTLIDEGRRRFEEESLKDYRAALKLIYGPDYDPKLDRSLRILTSVPPKPNK